jgi:hypothetical protein
MLSHVLAPPRSPSQSRPGDAPQHITKLADAIHRVSTSGHGGIKLSAGRNDQIPTTFATGMDATSRMSSGRTLLSASSMLLGLRMSAWPTSP